MQTRYLYMLRFVLALSDLAIINVCFFLGYYSSNKLGFNIAGSIFKHNILTCSIIWFLTSSICGLYTKITLSKLEMIYRATWKSIALHLFLFLIYLSFTEYAGFPKYFLLSFYGLLALVFLISRFVGTTLESLLMENFNIRKTVAVMGRNSGGIRLAAYLEQQSNVDFLGFLGEESLYIDRRGQLMNATKRQFENAANLSISEVFVSITPDKMSDIPFLLKEAEKHCVRLKFVPDLTAAIHPFFVEHMGAFQILSIRREPLEDMKNRFKKRFFDVVFSSLLIVFILSWLYILLAIIIKLQSKGPVLFKQLRTGRDNKPFWCYKFRSMRESGAEDATQTTKGDLRVTPIGKFMRKHSLDELPQFFNVFIGNMSVMGPRPHMIDHTEEYRSIIDRYMVRQFLKPGITGWAQVNGYRGETKEPSLMQKRVEHDIWYMDNWSAMLDIRIVFMTILNLFKGEENAY